MQDDCVYGDCVFPVSVDGGDTDPRLTRPTVDARLGMDFAFCCGQGCAGNLNGRPQDQQYRYSKRLFHC